MKISLPGGCQGDAQVVSQQRSQYSNVARTRNMNDIRAELTHEPQKLRVVPREQEIKLVVAIERELDSTAAKLNSGKRSIRYDFVARARMNQEEWESVFFCISRKLPARIRDTVYFAVRTGK
jgi:hypothetical protein